MTYTQPPQTQAFDDLFRNQHNKLEVFNVQAYGAHGDGTTDDAPAIQAAINAAAVYTPTGGAAIVFLPPGTYLLRSANITPKANIRIMGAGREATTVKIASTLTGGSSVPFRVSQSAPPYPAYIAITDMTIDCTNQAAVTGTAAIQLQGVDHMELARLRIVNPYGYGLSIGSVGGTPTYIAAPYIHDIVIEANNANNNDAIGGGGIFDLVIENVWIYKPGSTGLDITNVTRGSIRDYHVQTTAAVAAGGFTSDFGWQDIEIDGVFVTGPMLYGVLIQSSTVAAAQATKNITLRGLHLSGISANAVWIAGLSGAHITNVLLTESPGIGGWNSNNNGGDGVIFDYVDDLVYSNCLLYAPTNGAYATSITANCTNALVEGVNFAGIGNQFRPTTVTTMRVVNCPTFNPVGASVPSNAFAIAGSGSDWTNTTGVDGTLYCTAAGTTTQIRVNGVQVATTMSVNDSFHVVAGGRWGYTGSGAPTMVFVGE